MKTVSLCPECLKRVPAEYVAHGEDVYLKKSCPEHGMFETVVWRGEKDRFFDMYRDHGQTEQCPLGCGLCAEHLQQTCCIEVELTARCNLNCTYCLEDKLAPEPALDELKELFRTFVSQNRKFIHFTGGEATVRDDLPEVVRAAADAGMEYIQLNTNGVRLGEDEAYAKELADAGVSFVFLQFDGTTDEIYRNMRGGPLLDKKIAAIEHCGKYNLGVALVPTLVPGVNTDNIGEIIDFAVRNSPMVRGVHFQPVSYFGRYPQAPTDGMRITLPEVIAAIGRQAGIGRECFRYSACDHPMCGFHGDFVVMPDGLLSLTRGQQEPQSGGCSASKDPYEEVYKNRRFVGRRWKRPSFTGRNEDVASLEGFLQRIQSHGFTITAMAFQDAYTADVNRLRNCSLHIYSAGKVMPFCLRYILR